MKIRVTIISIVLFLVATAVQGQITIGGNVYGGGNAGNTNGKTSVTVYAGDLNEVYGGARQANVGGSAFVHIDGDHMSDDIIIINRVYGGNDISGSVGKSDTAPQGVDPNHHLTVAELKDFNTFVLTTKEKTDNHHIFIGQLYGGSNGDYDYESRKDEETNVVTHIIKDKKTHEEVATSTGDFIVPNIDKAFLDIHGGTIANAFGGGNNATINVATQICINNESTVTTDEHLGGKLTTDRLHAMGLNTVQTQVGSSDYQFGRVFGGNNKAAMAIRPTWHLEKGQIRDLYSGGNEGDMTFERGLLLEIPSTSQIEVNNVFGGCRKAAVHPKYANGSEVPLENILLADYKFPAGLSARVLVRGGDVNNVYGGNDISGSVRGGTAVGIYASIRGDVYGGGNGSYAYTDNSELAQSEEWGDFYYNPGDNSVDALNDFRPNVEQVSLRLAGTDATHPTIIGGSVYVGGNSATVVKNDDISEPIIELKIGSYVIADNVFLGNNGENMVDASVGGILAKYAGSVEGKDFSSLDLTNPDIFAKYMDGCAMSLTPRVVFDKTPNDPANYIPYSTYFGSFYCGGNVGSMTMSGTQTIDFTHQVVIFNKLVGGCNNAYVPFHENLNAAYEGGVIGSLDEQASFVDVAGNIKNRIVLNLINLKIEPKRWNDTHTELVWNTISAKTGLKVDPVTTLTPDVGETTETTDADDLQRRLTGGQVYGGCYSSGCVNGNVVINIEKTLMEPDRLFDKVQEDEEGEAILYGDNIFTQENYHIVERRTGVILGQQGMDVLGSALNIFGGGKGKDTEIWGSTTINLKGGYVFQIFGGSEDGVIGKGEAFAYAESAEKTWDGTYYYFNGKKYSYNPAYSCTVNLKGEYDGVTKTSTDNHSDMSDCEFIYGGGFLGPICGNTTINLGKGRIFNSFAGSCNADILGHTETYMGRQIKNDGTVGDGFPYVRDYIYGGNDLGGRILGTANFTSRVQPASTMLHSIDMPKNVSSYVEYTQGRAIGLFGGCYGTYDYTNQEYRDFFTAEGVAKPGYTKPRMDKAFVNFRPKLSDELKNKVTNTIKEIYGAGQGYPGDADRDIMQKGSYILIDIPQEMTNYKNMEVWGAGAWSGLGMAWKDDKNEFKNYVAPGTTGAEADAVSAIIDLPRGQIAAAYGGSYQEGVTRRTVVNVPTGSTIRLGSIFGGAYGTNTYMPCDVYESNVNWHSQNAVLVLDTVRIDPTTKQLVGDNRMKGAIFGGNNNERRTLYGRVNVDVPVKQDNWKYGNTLATIFGAGCGGNTWAEYTEVNLKNGAHIYEVYGGGQAGKVHNAESVQYFMGLPTPTYTWPEGYANAGKDLTSDEFAAAWKIGLGYDPPTGNDPQTNQPYTYWENTNTNLANPLARTAEIDDRDFSGLSSEDLSLVHYKYSTNVIINKGAIVENYAYGGGLGTEAVVAGTTYVGLLGGTVKKDIYAAGTSGAVQDMHGAGDYESEGNRAGFMASATAYVAGGTVRNVYGGGWKGSVGRHVKTVNGKVVEADITDPAGDDISGETHVVIGIRKDQTNAKLLEEIKKINPDADLDDYGFYYGVPTIQRNAYGGGEGGAVYGAAHLTINNGYVGYEYKYDETDSKWIYEDKINDETYYENEKYAGDNRLRDCGNVFGGGYDARSSVDESNITLWGGMIRGSVHGGGEIATIGRGSTRENGEANSERVFDKIYRAGKTRVEMFNGHVKRNVYGGGKGYNLLGYGSNSELYTDGYVFGQTEVHIHGGEVGTTEGVEDGYGNIFGGGDLGYVFSSGYTNALSRKTNTGSPGHAYYYISKYKCTTAYGNYKQNDVIDEITYSALSNDDKAKWEAINTSLTEDCKVVVSPYLQRKDTYEYVSTDYLNTLPKDKDDYRWGNLVLKDDGGERGIIIHNAVFGGGNVGSNSDTHYANATTVFGNATATICDVYHRDFITVGTEHVGGLYGGGNLSVVDGYRELNITNYGTDYYNMESRVTVEDYHNKLTNRERAYFKLEYQCQDDYDSHHKGDRISEADYNVLPAGEKTHWIQYGFCSIYAGRLLNTIQRADFCGVFGSRMVLQGAKDRVADSGENIDYTINRVGELSLNKQFTLAGDTDSKDATHGNYFGIYSVVNYLGNLTSDVRMKDFYVDASGSQSADKSFYSYKAAKPQDTWRNKGKSINEVALASGVFLELTTENSTPDHKDYGYITGVVQLDLINVKRDIQGGGYVYAKNEHRIPNFYADKENVILSDYNKQQTTAHEAAKTYKRYRYSATYDDGPKKGQSNDSEWTGAGTPYVIEGETAYTLKNIQTSGNFIHKSKPIVDDCYPINNAYNLNANPYSEAHFWYIKGSVYIYDQVVSAYTGSASAYSKSVNLPLTITAASHGKLKLLNVKPNRYAYYSAPDEKIGTGSSADDGIVWVNHQADGYKLNDAITWWDWQNLPLSEQAYFVENTYVNAEACIIDSKPYSVGEYVILPDDLDAMETAAITDAAGKPFEDENGNELTGESLVKHVFHPSNNISHDTGYVLTFDMDTPSIWNDYYTLKTDDASNLDPITKAEYDALDTEVKKNYLEGPTYSPKEKEGPQYYILGKRHYSAGQVITSADYNFAVESEDGDDKMEPAYVATQDVSYTYGGVSKTTAKGTAIGYTEWNSLALEKKSAFALAWVCTNTVQLEKDNYLLNGDLKTADEITAMKAIPQKLATNDEIDAALSVAYICKEDGEYGGHKYLITNNYTALQSWNDLSAADRTNFNYNYDALDLLVDPTYSVDPDAAVDNEKGTQTIYHDPYSRTVGVEYQAVFKGFAENDNPYSYNGITVEKGASIPNEVFEAKVPNYKRFYSKVTDSDLYDVTGSSDKYFYIATQNFIYDGEPYGIGQLVSNDVYTHNTSKVDAVKATRSGPFFYCYEAHSEGSNNPIPVGTIIEVDAYNALRDDHQYFVIQGTEPTETTTLYVNRESDAKDLTKEKIITVVYQYTYYEQDDDEDANGGSIRLTNELHVVNIHLQLESGVPTIGILENPPTVLPGQTVGMKNPTVSPGTYEVLTSGYELFADKNDAEHHRNGMPFTNNQTPVYWYQNGDHYIAFYSKTYLGKTYSNYVPLSVANYHDIADIMENHKDNHLYIDRADVDRPCKIYINDYSQLDVGDPRKDKNGLDELKNLFDLSLVERTYNDEGEPVAIASGTLAGHVPMDSHVKGGAALEFFLRTDIDHSTSWTSIAAGTGVDDPCFSGILHGDGHTISGLSQSLFGKLCGSVYNLGVTGSFNTAGIVDTGTGYVENCWIKTSNETVGTTPFAVFGNPTADEKWKQVVNCYYPKSNEALYSTATCARGNARMMPDQSFYNGEVAYNLNGFYLNKRFYDHTLTGTPGEGDKPYSYFTTKTDGTLATNHSYYPKKADTKEGYYGDVGYVEDRFDDGDFRYADGVIPETYNIRRQESEPDEHGNTVVSFPPIWPDDYLFFGQRLNYGYDDDLAHQELPSVIQKSNERVITSEVGNRVYRAPAYFRSNKMKMAHFNPNAIFAQHKKGDAETIAYQYMTAIDFTGGNGDIDGGYKQGLTEDKFYPPLLDDDGLTGFWNVDLTKNLLAYTYAPGGTGENQNPTARQQTTNVVSSVLYDFAYEETYSESYRRVAPWDYASNWEDMQGHWVQGNDERSSYTSARDHFLVDKQDFNAPISYQFVDDMRMWYQRTPELFAGQKKDGSNIVFDNGAGWEAISIPFSAEVVTTQQKGEITHFYGNSKKGHEYWLRELTGNLTQKKNENGALIDGVWEGVFSAPAVGNTDKDFTNTFLWDYYYSKESGRDANTDIYRAYYSESRTIKNYGYSVPGTPYLIGFPGSRYYEFDLSGTFEPEHTYRSINRLDPQIITFASAENATIAVSDTELSEGEVEVTATGKTDKYTFTPNYLSKSIDAGAYFMNDEGSSYTVTTSAEEAVAFRPYFTKKAQTQAGARGAVGSVRSIVFNDDGSEMKGKEPIQEEEKLEGLIVNGGRKVVVVKSNLHEEKEVNIVNMAGVTLAAFTIQPGETITTNVALTGVYIVRTTDGRYTKKVLVR